MEPSNAESNADPEPKYPSSRTHARVQSGAAGESAVPPDYFLAVLQEPQHRDLALEVSFYPKLQVAHVVQSEAKESVFERIKSGDEIISPVPVPIEQSPQPTQEDGADPAEEQKAAGRGKEYSWLSGQDRQRWHQDWDRKAEAATEFAKRMRSIQLQIRQREEEKRRRVVDKIERERESKERERAKVVEAMEDLRALEAQRRWEDFEAKRKARRMITELAEHTPQKRTYLYQKMYKQYVDKVHMPELERRKQSLAEKRNAYAPLRHEEIKEHERMCEEIAQKCEDERRKELEKRRLDEEDYRSKAAVEYKTSFTRQIMLKDARAKQRLKLAMQKQKENYNKKMTYGRIVKESYLPTPSESKAQELKSLISKLRHPVRKANPRSKPCPNRPSNVQSYVSNENAERSLEYGSPSEEKLLSQARTPEIHSSLDQYPSYPHPKPAAYDDTRKGTKSTNAVALSKSPKAVAVNNNNNKLHMQAKSEISIAGPKSPILRSSAASPLALAADISVAYVDAIRAKLSLLEV